MITLYDSLSGKTLQDRIKCRFQMYVFIYRKRLEADG